MDPLFARLRWFNHYDIGDEIEGGDEIKGVFLYFSFASLSGVRGLV